MLINWIEDADAIRTSKYWNNFEEEKNKIFNVHDGNFIKLEQDSNLINIYRHLKEISTEENIDWNKKQVLSLASGTCWLEARFLNDKNINRFTAVDFSKHRIHGLAPKIIEHYKLDKI